MIPDNGKFIAALHGSIVNIENESELDAFLRTAQTFKKHVNVGIRVTFDLEDHDESRFGFVIGSDSFKSAIAHICSTPYVSLAGVHCHFGSARQIKYWEAKIGTMSKIAKELSLEYINIGGGMFGQMPPSLSDQFDGYVQSFDLYADAVCSVMKETFPECECELFIEPGTALVGNVMDTVAIVTSIKNDRREPVITVDCSSSDIGYLCEHRDIPVDIIHVGGNKDHVKNGKICGCTCLEGDILKKHFSCDISVGDKVVFRNTGAYSINCSNDFISPKLCVKDSNGYMLLRPRHFLC